VTLIENTLDATTSCDGDVDSTTSSDRPPSPQKAGPRGSLSFQFLEIGDIRAHPMVRKIQKDVGFSLRELPTTIISEAGLVELAFHSPLHVTLEESKFYCISGLKIFRLIRNSLPENSVIPVIVHDGYNAKKLRNHILFDLFFQPVVASVDTDDRKLIGTIWSDLQKEDVFSRNVESTFDAVDALTALLHCDRRTLRKVASESDQPKSE